MKWESKLLAWASLLIILGIIFMPLKAQWAMTYGGGDKDEAFSIISTSDNGYLLLGTTTSFGPGDYDALVLKISASGELEWQKIYRTSGDDKIFDAVELPGGGYLLAGETEVTFNTIDKRTILLMIVSEEGELITSKTFSLSTNYQEAALRIQTTSDGHYLLQCLYSGPMLNNGFIYIKVDGNGNLKWARQTVNARGIAGVVAGGDKFLLVEGGQGSLNVGLYDSSLNYLDHQKFSDGSAHYYDIKYVLDSNDGGYYLVGGFSSDELTPSYTDVVVIKLKSDLEILWQKTYSANIEGYVKTAITTDDGGLLFDYEALLKIDSSGAIDWERKYDDFYIAALVPAVEGDGYLAVGKTNSRGEGNREAMLIRLNLNGELDPSCNLEESINHTTTDLSLVQINDTPPNWEEVTLTESSISMATGVPEVVTHLICPCQSYIYLSPFQRVFGADGSGRVTDPQQILIRNTGCGQMNWNIDSNATWLSVSPESGTDAQYLTLSVDPTGMSPGEYTGLLTIAAANTFNSPKSYSVKLKIYGSGYVEENPPFGSFDTPADGSTVSGNIPVTGWALDDIQVNKVIIKRSPHPDDPPEAIGSDGLVYVGDVVFVRGARPDVQSQYYDYPLAERAGWGYMMLTNMLPGGGNDNFTIYAIAEDVSGNQTVLGEKNITCDNNNRTKPFGTIDTPAQGERISGSNYINFGWALTQPPKEIPRDGSTIWVWLDGQPLGHPDYNHYRSDIATLFPNCLNSDGAVGFYFIDTTSFENGLHNLSWSVEDNWGESDGIGSRWIEIFNSGGSGSSIQQSVSNKFRVLIPPVVHQEALLRATRDHLKISLIGWSRGLKPISLVNSSQLMKFKVLSQEKNGRIPRSLEKKYIAFSQHQLGNIILNKLADWNCRNRKSSDLLKKKVAWIDEEGIAWIRIKAGERIELHFRVEEGYTIIGWGRSTNDALPPGSCLDAKKKIFYWWPGPGVKGHFILHFATTDGQRLSRPLSVRIGVD